MGELCLQAVLFSRMFLCVPGCESWVNNGTELSPAPLPRLRWRSETPAPRRAWAAPPCWMVGSAAVSTTSSCSVLGWITRGIPAEMCFTPRRALTLPRCSLWWWSCCAVNKRPPVHGSANAVSHNINIWICLSRSIFCYSSSQSNKVRYQSLNTAD